MTFEDLEGKKILTIDDESAIRTSFRNYLEDYDFVVEEAINGREGLDKIRSFEPDVVLVDLRMPEVDGLGVLDAVRSIDENLPVIVISGTGEIADVVAALRKGAWDYLLKPVQDMTIVLHAIQTVLERAELIRKNEEYKNELERKVIERTEELQMVNQDLKAFDYSVSNALQAPLRIVAGFCNILKDEYDKKLDEEGKKYLENITNSVNECRGLISELLKMSRVIQRDMKMESLSFNDYLKAEFIKVLKKYGTEGVELKIGEEIVVEGDPHLLSFALNSIVDNSVKAMLEVDKPVIQAGTKEIDGEIVYYIRDCGTGFDQSRAMKIFEPFHSYHTDVDFSGKGLSLATTRRIIKRHGGSIWAESEPGEGTTIYFSLGNS